MSNDSVDQENVTAADQANTAGSNEAAESVAAEAKPQRPSRKALQQTMAIGSNVPALSVGSIVPPSYLWAALSAMAQVSSVRNAVLIVFSREHRGRIGVFRNRYLSGAVVESTGETGIEALRILLGAQNGIFGFRSCMPVEGAELAQGFCVDIAELCKLHDAEKEKYANPALALPDYFNSNPPVDLQSIIAADEVPLTADESSSPLSYFDALAGGSSPGNLPKLGNVLMAALPSMPLEMAADPSMDSAKAYEKLVQQELGKVNKHLESSQATESSKGADIVKDLQLFTELLQSERNRAESWNAASLSAIPTPSPTSVAPSKFAAECADLVGEVSTPVMKLSKPAVHEELSEENKKALKRSRRLRILTMAVGVAVVIGLICIGVNVYSVFERDTLVAEGIKLMKSGNSEGAIENFSAALQRDPDYGRVFFQRALAYQQTKQGTLALNDLDAALALGENKARILIAKAAVEESLQQYDKALADCTSVIHEDPKNLQAYQMRILVHSRMHHYESAARDCATALVLCKDNAEKASLLQQRAFAEAKMHNWFAALKDISEAIDLVPSEVAYLQRGDVHRALHKFDNAIEDYSATIKLNPQSYAAYVARGYCYLQRKKADLALADFDSAVKINDMGVAALLQRGGVYMDKKEWQKALDDFNQVKRINPNVREIHQKIALASEGLRKASKAKAPVSVVAVSSASTGIGETDAGVKMPENTQELITIGYAKLSEGSPEEAITYLAEAIRREPNSRMARRYLAYALAQRGDFANATAQLKALNRMKPLNDKDLLMLGVWLEKCEEQENAMEVLLHLVQRSPDYLEAKAQLAKIYFDYGFPKKGNQLCEDGLQRAKTPADRKLFEDLLRAEAAAMANKKPAP